MGPDDLGQIAISLVLHGAGCVLFGAVIGYLLGPGIIYQLKRLRPRKRRDASWNR